MFAETDMGNILTFYMHDLKNPRIDGIIDSSDLLSSRYHSLPLHEFKQSQVGAVS